MNDEQIEKIMQMNLRLLYVMGYGTSIMLQLAQLLPNSERESVDWFIKAVENIVYFDGPPPPLP